MAKGPALGSSSEYVYHTAGVRMRLQGVGNLNMRLVSLDNARTYEMKPLPMSMTPGIEPTRIANFKSQRTTFRIETTEMNEYFRISRMVIFMKPSATSLPM